MARSLSPKPSLEHLRKQAKDLLRAHGAGKASVCATLRLLRRFENASDRDILGADVTLQEVQYAVALEYGFENWSALKEHVEGAKARRAAGGVLHVHCGDSSADTLRNSGVPGDVRVWCDPLCEGPTPVGVSDDEWRRLRAEHHVSVGNARTVAGNLQWQLRQDEALEAFASYGEVVLWFDACMFDQSILIRQLDWFGRQRAAKAGTGRPAEGGPASSLRFAGASPRFRLSLICVGEFAGFEKFRGLGELSPEQMTSLLDTRHEVTPAETAAAQRAWAAWRSPDPADVEAAANADTSALPYLNDALVRHLEQFPSVYNGLGRLENEALDVIASGQGKLGKIFVGVSAKEERPFFGDSTLWACLDELANGRTPLLEIDGPGRLPLLDSPEKLSAWTVTATDAGRDVLDGRADAVALNGIDRWLGGMHLSGAEAVWRWDGAEQRLKQVK
jgi:hypothetical protein